MTSLSTLTNCDRWVSKLLPSACLQLSSGPHNALNDFSRRSERMIRPRQGIPAFPVRYNAADWLAKPFESMCLARTCSFCDSTVYLGRGNGKKPGRIVICVFRNLGNIKDATDPDRLSHTAAQGVHLRRLNYSTESWLSTFGRITAQVVWRRMIEQGISRPSSR